MTENTPSDALVEAMARAIYEADDPWHVAWPWPDLQSDQAGVDHYRRCAEAAAAVNADALAERDAEIERLRAYVYAFRRAECRADRLAQTVEDQAKQIEALRANADRYQWLRDRSCPPHNFYISVPDEFAGTRYAPDDVDAYIDEARAALGSAKV